MQDQPIFPAPLAPHTSDVAEMIAAGHMDAALEMHAAHVTASYEREDLDAGDANEVDLGLAGYLLEAVFGARERELIRRAA